MNNYPTPQDRLELSLNWLESEGFALYYNNKLKEWGLFQNTSDVDRWYSERYYLVSEDKYRIINQAFHDLAH